MKSRLTMPTAPQVPDLLGTVPVRAWGSDWVTSLSSTNSPGGCLARQVVRVQAAGGVYDHAQACIRAQVHAVRHAVAIAVAVGVAL